MIFRQFIDYATHTFTYLIACPQKQVAALVDPVLERAEQYLKLLHELELKLLMVLETHIHADHITAASLLREATGAKALVPMGAQVQCADGFVHDKDNFAIGTINIHAISTSGHTDAHMAYLVDNQLVLTGDALFVRGCGRTDFQSGCSKRLYQSVHERLFVLPDTTLVYPGHDYNGNTCSTIGEEKRFNPRLADKKEGEFSKIMDDLNLAEPTRMKIALLANARCGQIPTGAAID